METCRSPACRCRRWSSPRWREELVAALRSTAGGCWRARRSPAIRSSPSSPPPRPTSANREAMDAIDELLQRDLIRLTSVPRRFRFRHPIVRRAVYEATPGGWRHRGPRRVAQALADRGAAAAVLAHHIELSAKVGDMAAVATLDRGRPAVRPARAGDGGALVLRRAATAPRHGAVLRTGRSAAAPAPPRWRRPATSPKPIERSLRASPSSPTEPLRAPAGLPPCRTRRAPARPA